MSGYRPGRRNAPEVGTMADTTNDETRYFLMAFRKVGEAIEQTTLSAAEIPLSVLSSIGVSEDFTSSARDSSTQLIQGIHGTVDAIAGQIAEAVSTGSVLVGNTVGDVVDAAGDAAKRVTAKS
jgi:hypothetical protein